MENKVKPILKRIGIIAGVLVLIAIAFGVYLNSILPKPIGSPIQLQTVLFEKPAQARPMEGKYIFRTASELAAMIRRKEARSVDIVQEFLANIHNNNWKYNALIWLREQEALEEARLADEAVSKGDTTGKPMLGVPVTIKEMFWVKGSPSTMNAKMFGFTAPRDAEVVQQIKQAGAIILGTTNVPFMLGDYQTQGEVYPTGSNPYDTTRTPGGSTGGGAAALAAGFTSLELGSDLGGSIRVPAAFCGLWALKPTFGTVNITQGTGPDTITPLRRGALASGGPLARSAEDLELMWNVIKETPVDPRFQELITWAPPSSKTLPQYKIAWMDEWQTAQGQVKIGSGVKEKLNAFIQTLQNKGVQTQKKTLDTYHAMCRAFYGTFASMMADGQPWLLRKLIAMDFKKMDNGSADFQAFYEAMGDASDNKWAQLQNERMELKNQWEAFFKENDFFICPISYGPAFKKCPQGTPIPGDNHTAVAYMDYFPYSFIFNSTGHPVVVVPLGLDADGLPIAVQVVGPYHSESELLAFAKQIAPLVPGFIRPGNL